MVKVAYEEVVLTVAEKFVGGEGVGTSNAGLL